MHQWKIKMDNYLNENNMSEEMNWGTFVPTKEIREYNMKLRESVRRSEQLKLELAELENQKKDKDVKYAMPSIGVKHFKTCSECRLIKIESEYIKAEIAAEKSQE